MKRSLCVICRKNPAREHCVTCSTECSIKHIKAYRQSERYKDYQKAYQRLYSKGEKNKQYKKDYYLKIKKLRELQHEMPTLP